jgi:V/A-type H+-transporting ATPase subunit E
MRTLDENIDMLSRSILSDANGDAEEILTAARAKADSIREHAQQQADAEKARILEQSSREAERIRSQVVATTQLKSRTMMLEHREKLLDSVFKAAREQLPSLEQWSDYNEIALRLLREALVQLKAKKVVIHADEKTQKLLTEAVINKLAEELELSLTVGKPLENGIGVVVESADGHLTFDNTLDTRLERLQGALRSPVYHLLMGEML